jgi:hypothetical protein
MLPRPPMARRTDNGPGGPKTSVLTMLSGGISRFKNDNPTPGLLKTILYLCETTLKARGASPARPVPHWRDYHTRPQEEDR